MVDNPKHLKLIGHLEKENARISGLLSKINELENREPEVIEKIVEKEVERLVDNPEHLKQIDHLKKDNSQISGLMSQITDLKNREPKVVEKIVEKKVERLVDNPEHLKKIAVLEGELSQYRQGLQIDISAAKSAGISIKSEDDFTAIEGVDSEINDLIHADGIRTFRKLSETTPGHIQKILDKAGPKFKMAIPGTWPAQAHLASTNRWSALKSLQGILVGGKHPEKPSGETSVVDNTKYISKIEKLEKKLESYRKKETIVFRKGSVADLELAKSAGFNIRRKGDKDDFTVIEGIGKKINSLMHDNDIHTYEELANTDIAEIQDILDKAGPNFKLANPNTWPSQSDLAALNLWETLKDWQDELDGGKE